MRCFVFGLFLSLALRGVKCAESTMFLQKQTSRLIYDRAFQLAARGVTSARDNLLELLIVFRRKHRP
uniref:Putative secreted protein n=1 Tax=Anopheles triannulatus TaxID=58253 RepID=A0A2M4B8H0_9DIPT